MKQLNCWAGFSCIFCVVAAFSTYDCWNFKCGYDEYTMSLSPLTLPWKPLEKEKDIWKEHHPSNDPTRWKIEKNFPVYFKWMHTLWIAFHLAVRTCMQCELVSCNEGAVLGCCRKVSLHNQSLEGRLLDWLLKSHNGNMFLLVIYQNFWRSGGVLLVWSTRAGFPLALHFEACETNMADPCTLTIFFHGSKTRQ